MKLFTLLISIITFSIQPVFTQNTLDNSGQATHNTIQEPLLDRLALEKQFGGYEPPGAPAPLPNITFKGLDHSLPNISTGGVNSDGRLKSSLTVLENSLLEKSGDGKKVGGSLSMSLDEAEKKIADQKISNDTNPNESAIRGLLIVLTLVMIGTFIFLFTNKKNDARTKKIEKNDDNNIVEKESYDVNKIISSLEKIRMLKESNVITEQQFEKLKKELLD